MATSFGTAASVTENVSKSAYLPLFRRRFFHLSSSNKISFIISPKPKLRLSIKSGWHTSMLIKAQQNEVAVDGSSKASPSSPGQSKAKDSKLSNEAPPKSLASEESISALINQVSNLVKLVDSKDIVELQLNHSDCEILIRKKEALTPPPSPVMYVQSPPQPAAALPAPMPVPTAAPSAPPSPSASSSTPPTKALPSKSSHPPLKSPMAGTLYRSPGPSEPPFVKVGDKVQKGQVLCIIEAMKLMNEIEADQSGTIVEILVEDAKPVSVETPLFVIEP